MTSLVFCRSDSAYAERPLAFVYGERRMEILEILGRWRTPRGRRFLVMTEDHALFNLFYDEKENNWQVNQSSISTENT